MPWQIMEEKAHWPDYNEVSAILFELFGKRVDAQVGAVAGKTF